MRDEWRADACFGASSYLSRGGRLGGQGALFVLASHVGMMYTSRL
jgi:hypothetical protein